VLFVEEGEYLMPQDLEVDERYQGQGIAAAMYDYVKSKGYKIRRSGQQTDAGAGFWGKHRPEQNVWENEK
jgi:GNAT superfamily N-acetyltransferase